MRILSIETSCDETAVSILEAEGDFPNATYTVLGNALFSQIEIHKEYGGVFPAVAKREHAKTLTPMLTRALEEARLLEVRATPSPSSTNDELFTILHREPGLGEQLATFLETHERPPIDLIAVTTGPGLEPTLWVGINFARALSFAWDIPVASVNHMEGHILSSIFSETQLPKVAFPALALLISGGHTELVKIDDWATYTKIGETRDDAVGEAFDKVARMMGLPYPGGPEVSARARSARAESLPEYTKLPRPMLDADNLDFSFSGLKTAVRYAIEGKVNAEGREGALGQKDLSENDRAALSRDFEDAVTEVLLKKTIRAINTHNIQTLIVGGGVSANTHIRETFTTFFEKEYPHVQVFFPPRHLSTDNSVMIALAGHAHASRARVYADLADMHANGNLSL